MWNSASDPDGVGVPGARLTREYYGSAADKIQRAGPGNERRRGVLNDLVGAEGPDGSHHRVRPDPADHPTVRGTAPESMAHPRKRATFGSVLLAILAGSPVAAQEISSPYRYIERGQEVGPVVGYLDTDRGRFGLGPAPAVFYGAAYAVSISGPVALEGTVSVMPTERDVVNPRRVEGDRVLPDPAEVALLNVAARLRFNLTGRRTWNGIQPFVTAGAGLMFDVEGEQAEDQPLQPDERYDFGTEFNGVFGGGLRAILADRFALRAEAALTLYQVEIPDGWRDPDLGLGGAPESEWVSAPTLSLSLGYLF